MFDIFYIGKNQSLVDRIPFAKKIESADKVNSNTKMYWLIESNIEIIDYDIFDFRPEEHDQVYEHIWKWDNNNYGGVTLLPKTKSEGTKEINKVVCKKSFDILYTKTPGKYFESNVLATHVWCIDKEYKLPDDINWAPSNFEPNFIHSFHLRGQLEHKYPAEEGGIKLYPRNWKECNTKYHNFLNASATYPIFYVKDVEDYSQRKIFTDDYVWLIDSQYKINASTMDWVPNPFEDTMIHVFKMPYQLQEKYPQAMGGIRLVPKKWHEAETKIHPGCPVEDESYDVFYVDEDEFTAESYTECAERSKTDWFWVVDREFQFNGKLLYVPAIHERDYIHVFKIPGHLDERYPADYTDAWDNRCGGVRLVHKEFDMTKHKYQPNVVPVRYDIYFTDDITEYNTFARKSRTDAFWLVDKEHTISKVFKWVPPYSEQKYINVFKLPKQLEHKYPRSITNTSDNRCGGIKLVPKNYNENDIKYQGLLTEIELVEFEKFDNEQEGRAKTKHDWFWVIEPDVDVHEDFNFDFMPDTWDEGKTHVWQKLNPITGRQYDYGGVSLCPKVAQTKGRPKYMREPACTQKEYPVYTLTPEDYKDGLNDVYERLAHRSNTDMYWVVDAFTQLDENFDFSYYPTQWDKKNVHVFQNDSGDYVNVRLIPKNTFIDKEYTDKDIANNSFEHLKQINTIASNKAIWPVIHLQSLEKKEFVNAIKDIETPFVWTIDPDVKVDQSVLDKGFMPVITDVNKVHAWQKTNPRNGKVHAYGGLRLWPTNADYTDITSSELKLNRIKNMQYVKEPGSESLPFNIVFLSYQEDIKIVEQHIQKITNKGYTVEHVRGVKGIFEAHKKAANKVNSKMFWVVDADADVVDDFNFDYIPDVYDEEVVHVWGSKNPVNNLEYGYGGVKLFPTEMVRNATSWGIDFTTGLSSRFKSMPQISCITKFNTDEFNTWRGAFRECVKLTLNKDLESEQRLNAWMNSDTDADFVEFARRGALEGNLFAKQNANNLTQLEKINDYEWLQDRFNKS